MDDDAQRPCARGDRCSERDTDGPALGPRPFCESDRILIGRCIQWLPEAFARLWLEIGHRSSGSGEKVATSRTPATPINLEVDALLGEMVEVVASWAERVADVAHLHEPGTATLRRRRDSIALTQGTGLLAAHLDVLLGLPADAMARAVPLDEQLLDGYPHGVAHPGAGTATVNVDMSGADAGIELLAVHRRCRHVLGLTPRHEHVPVACWACGNRTVRRWDGAAGLADEAECVTPECGERYEGDRYEALMAEVHDARAGSRQGRVA